MSYTTSLKTHNGLVGKIGEDFACEYLQSKGHVILERNHRIKLGEIDAVTFYKNRMHIIEIKTTASKNVKSEENMNIAKMRRVARLGEIYAKGKIFCIDFVGVYLNTDKTLKKITYLENIEIY
jgi:putative endonuclease